MIEIPLSVNARGGRRTKNYGKYSAVVDDCDYDTLAIKSWAALVQGKEPNLRVYAVHRGVVRMHRVVWERHNGPIPNGWEIDHINPGTYCGLDNRLSNLRLVNKSLNQANERKSSNNTSGYKGVWWQKQARMWRVDIWVRGTKRHVGYFTDKVEAAKAYDAAARDAFGEFARVNFPEAA